MFAQLIKSIPMYFEKYGHVPTEHAKQMVALRQKDHFTRKDKMAIRKVVGDVLQTSERFGGLDRQSAKNLLQIARQAK